NAPMSSEICTLSLHDALPILRMGGLVEQQVSDALESFLQADSALAQQVQQVEQEVDDLEKHIDEECARVLALRQPAAIDLRTIIDRKSTRLNSSHVKISYAVF